MCECKDMREKAIYEGFRCLAHSYSALLSCPEMSRSTRVMKEMCIISIIGLLNQYYHESKYEE